MTQIEILDFLKKNPDKWFDTNQISKGINKLSSNVSQSLKSMRKFNMVNFKTIKEEAKGMYGKYYYKFKKVNMGVIAQ